MMDGCTVEGGLYDDDFVLKSGWADDMVIV